MCGSGTFLIEAGLIAVRRAPRRCTRTSASSAGPRSGAEARADRSSAPRRGPRRRAARALPHPRVRPERGGGRGRRGQRATRPVSSREVSIAEADATRRCRWRPRPGLLVTNPPYGDRLARRSEGDEDVLLPARRAAGRAPRIPDGRPLGEPGLRERVPPPAAAPAAAVERAHRVHAARVPGAGLCSDAGARRAGAAARCFPGASRASRDEEHRGQPRGSDGGVPGTSQAAATATTPASSEPTELIRKRAKTPA